MSSPLVPTLQMMDFGRCIASVACVVPVAIWDHVVPFQTYDVVPANQTSLGPPPLPGIVDVHVPS